MQQKGAAVDTKGLDLRILSITIILSPTFMCRALIDSLYAWNLFSANLETPYKDIFLVVFTEVLPCLLISYIMKKKRDPIGPIFEELSDETGCS